MDTDKQLPSVPFQIGPGLEPVTLEVEDECMVHTSQHGP